MIRTTRFCNLILRRAFIVDTLWIHTEVHQQRERERKALPLYVHEPTGVKNNRGSHENKEGSHLNTNQLATVVNLKTIGLHYPLDLFSILTDMHFSHLLLSTLSFKEYNSLSPPSLTSYARFTSPTPFFIYHFLFLLSRTRLHLLAMKLLPALLHLLLTDIFAQSPVRGNGTWVP